MSRIFISYSRKDEEFARKLAGSLSELGANIWIDVQDIPAGMKWSTAIQQGLNVCEVMLLVVSPDSMASTNVEDEWQHYFDKRKPVIPIRWRPAEIHFQLNRIQYVDFHEKPYDMAFHRLIAALREKGAVFAQNGGKTNSHLTTRSNSKPQDIRTILPPPFEWCPVTAGQVTLESGGYVPEGGKTFPVEAFDMAKYPVTNAQYDTFVRDGYADPQWWNYSPEAVKWRGDHPKSMDTDFVGDDLPRTNVSWYDAVAFCRWLNAKLSPSPNPLPIAWTGRINLPTEQQWQRVAQGDDGRTYPWGAKFDKSCCNFNTNSPTPVTQYPNGESPFHVLDMSGNVWEWCSTNWGIGADVLSGTDVRVLRGGSWRNNSVDLLRAAYRNSNYPYGGNLNGGFRLARSL